MNMPGLLENARTQGPLHRIAMRGSDEEQKIGVDGGLFSFFYPLFLTCALSIFACPELKAGTRYKKIPMS
jgi:hypothetical protein